MTHTAVRTSLRVRTRTWPAGPADPLTIYTALADRFGPSDVYLLESVTGPEVDTRESYVGFRELLSVSVTRGVVRVTGLPALVSEVRRRTDGLLDGTGGELTLPDPRGLWDVLRAVHACFDAPGSRSTFRFGFLAFFGYDTARYIEDLPFLIEQEADLPDVALVLHQGHVRIGAGGDAELVLHECDAWPALDAADLLPLPAPAPAPGEQVPASRATDVSDSTTPDLYHDSVGRCLEHIAAGDIYQVQIGHEFAMRSAAGPVDVYRRLRARNPSPYMYLAPLAGHTVVGASPELFARVEDGLVTMRPIAGTLPCGPGDEPDPAAVRRLRQDPKEIAEHVMLVDLCRNDIGRICAPGTLDVPHMLVVERYARLLHLVSTVTGRLDAGLDGYDVVAALFPSGTMTGAPKVRAMEIIESVESSRRGIYAGALGLVDVGGFVNLALCIRTLVHGDGVYRARASAGVVADSTPQREWNETIAKLGAAHWAVTGEEPRA
ncbi:anthranilate synthase component I family protein [Microbispora sp. RL4-1S]|uniref:Anthranilate synthase component I family protein n=1 Tax=Microbispora oryzae TaxID=2806554 RepID=A0A940WFQ1_9ACTN|nr:anthranilate synthase component I family protein [Microbispora oryzae]MBP2703232.1 anthranilate synthase component I family protein [Microbispora oryzae]